MHVRVLITLLALVAVTSALPALASTRAPHQAGSRSFVQRHAAGSSAVQRHASFRRCVGQSCAEFVLDALDQATPGVALPEERYADRAPRERILARLSSTPGTTGYRVG